jgi:hypothetical protein
MGSGPKDRGPAVSHLMAAILVTTGALLAVAVGCTSRQPVQSTSPSSAILPPSSQVTTEAINARLQAVRKAKRDALAELVRSLDAELASKASDNSSETKDTQGRRDALAAQLDALDAELEAATERYDALKAQEDTAAP